MQKNSIFYQRQRPRIRSYRAAQVLAGFVAAGSAAALPLLCWPPSAELWLEWVVFSCLAAVGVFLFALVQVRCLGSYTRLAEQYEALSPRERQEMEEELAGSFRGALFGQNNLYLYSRGLLHFVRYGDIVWAYKNILWVPLLLGAGSPVSVETAYGAGSLVLYDRRGNRLEAPADADSALRRLAAEHPHILIGFSKERLRLARKDFDRLSRLQQEKENVS